MTDAAPHMTPDEFRRHGYEVIDWIASYMETVDQLPVLSQSSPGEIRSMLPPSPPAEPEPFDRILADVERIVMPGITHWQSPNFFAYFSANASGPSILGELMSAGLGVQGMLWATSPACTEVETHMLDWMVELCGLPTRFRSDGPGGGVIQDSASSSTLTAIIAARERAGGSGELQRMVVYTSEHAHSSVEKGSRIAGIPGERVRAVRSNDHHALDPEHLADLVAVDRAAGLVPVIVIATAGTTSSTAFDPVDVIADIADANGIWLHVDAAFAGSAAVCPELRFVNAGVERVDSYVFNPHKWLLVNFDCSLFYVADRRPLVDALTVLPEYLRNAASDAGAVVDYRDWHIPLGRRFRALKLWFTIRHYGVSGLRAHIRNHVAHAREFAEWVDQHTEFELAAPVPLSLVCFRHVGGDDVNRRILDHCNDSGDLYLTHTVLDNKFTLRLAVGAVATELRHVEAAWVAIVDAAAES